MPSSSASSTSWVAGTRPDKDDYEGEGKAWKELFDPAYLAVHTLLSQNYGSFHLTYSNSPPTYEGMLQNAGWKEKFLSWARGTKHNEEEVAFLAQVEAYMANPNWNLADQIVAQYLAGDVVNVDAPIKDPIIEQCQNRQRRGRELGDPTRRPKGPSKEKEKKKD